jgi:hypothetical protein
MITTIPLVKLFFHQINFCYLIKRQNLSTFCTQFINIEDNKFILPIIILHMNLISS